MNGSVIHVIPLYPPPPSSDFTLRGAELLVAGRGLVCV